jgi:protein TonB
MRRTLFLSDGIAGLLTVIALSLSGSAIPAQQQPDPDVVYEIGNGVMAPKVVYAPNPEYTDKARKKKINGTVVVAMIVSPEGRVRDVRVAKSLDKELDKQALAAVSKWRFEPATKDGEPVAVHLKAEVSFRLY